MGVGGLRPTGRPARFRQFRHRLPAGDGGGRGLPDHGGVRWRRLAALAADAPDPRSAGIDGRQSRRGQGRRPPAADAARRPRSRADPLPDAGGLGPDQVGGAAGGARRARRHHRDRAGSQPRPHRTDAETFWRRDRLDERRQPRPQDRAHRPARTARRRCRGARRSVLGRIPDRGGADRRRLRRRVFRRHDQSAAHRPVHDAARDGRFDRGKRSPRRRRRADGHACACAPQNCAASRCRRSARPR